MIKSGLAFHCHHDIVFEFVYNYDERVRFILDSKPKGEQELRLRLFKMIPDELIPGKGLPEWEAYCKAGEVYDKAWEAYCKAGQAYDKTGEAYYKTGEVYRKAGEVYYKAGKAYDKTGEVYYKTGEAYRKAWGAYCKKHHKELEKLHTNLCPDCPWDGKTIFCT